ncbi:MAG TPA: FimV/HubP family polar landmark protein [Gallionellaceae bacterium]
MAAAAAAAPKKPAAGLGDEIDVISEADLFLNYGRDQQAEDLLKEALQKSPGNIPIQLKLLSIYATRKDLNKFTTIARQIQDSGDAAAWEQTCVLGRSVDAGNPMYGEATGAEAAAAPEPLTESGKQNVQPLDMDVGFNIPMDLDITSAAAPQPGAGTMDFDVSAYTSLPAMDLDVTGVHEPVESLLPDFDVTGGHPSSAELNMDFDVTGSHPNVVGTTSMDFDVTGSHPLPTELPGANMSTVVLESEPAFAAAAPALAASSGMDFDLSAFSAPAPAAAAPAMETAGSGGMDFELGSYSAPAPAVAPAMEAPATEGMDFDLSAFSAPAPAAVAPAAEPAAELGGLDFDITGSHPLVVEAPGAEMSTMVLSEAMDFNVAAAPAEAAPVGLGGLDFNITGAGAAGAEPSAALGGLDFNITGNQEGAGAAGAEPSAALGGLDFNITGEKAAATAEAPLDTTAVLGAAMDFDISAPSPAVTPASEAGLNYDLSVSESMVHPAVSGSELAEEGGMDFDISAPHGAKAEPAVDLSAISLDVSAGEGKGVADTVVFPTAEPQKDERWEEVQNKLELATAFLEGMGDADTARELLGEVLNEGDAQQAETARTLLQKI